MQLSKRIGIAASCVMLLSTILSSCSGTVDNYKKPSAAVSEDDTGWEEQSSGKIRLENEKISFELDTETSHFTVTDNNSGKQYTSVPTGEGDSYSDDILNRLQSEITIKYFENSIAHFMYSTLDGVKNNGLKIKRKDNTVRVYYTFGTSDANLFVPEVILATTYEKDIIKKLKSTSAVRRMGLCYSLYSSKEPTDEYKKMLEKYPALADHDLYILKDSISSLQKVEINDKLKEIGYNQKDYEAFLKKYKINIKKAEFPGFVIPVEYKLQDDGFKAIILSDKITEQSENFKLQKIDLLQFFASTDANARGYYLVPDGSGATIDMNTNKSGTYSQNLYGDDISLLSKKKTQLADTAMLPIFGISQNDGGLFGIVEGAVPVSTLSVQTRGASSPRNTVYTSFAYRTIDVIVNNDMATADSPTGEYNLYCSSALTELPSVRYSFLPANQADYSGMAAYYRNYLQDKDQLPDSKELKDVPLLLDFNCMVTSENTVFGFTYDKKIVLSTLSEIKDILENFYNKGIENIIVRINGYDPNGLSHGVSTALRLDKKVGSLKQLKELSELVSTHGGKLYLEADFQTVFKDEPGDGFSQRGDSSYFIDKTLVHLGSYDLVTRDYSKTKAASFYVSPARYKSFALSYIKSLKSQLKDTDYIGLSYRMVGNCLSGDYNSKNNFNRTASLKLLNDTLKELSVIEKGFMTDGGNAYVLPYAGFLVNMPLSSSGFDIESGSVPFYQMVVHGSIPCFGVSYNQSEDPKICFLRGIEYGTSLHYTLMSRENALLRGTDYEAATYSLFADDWTRILIDQYTALKPYFEKTQNIRMIRHEKLTETVYCTIFENGVKAVINYGNEPAEIEGIKIGALDYHIFF